MNRPGDWNCMGCNHLNFQWRDSCQKCGESRPGVEFGGRSSGGGSYAFTSTTSPGVRPGDWYCTVANCGAHNFASRSSCFKCGAPKDSSSSSTGYNDFGYHDLPRNIRSVFAFATSATSTTRPAGWKSGDWICNRSGCNEHNFASRTECFRCNASREQSTTASSP